MISLSLRPFLRWFAFALPLLSITYLVRFRIAGFPSTVLEVLVWVLFVGTLLVTRRAGLVRAQGLLRVWRWPIVAWVITSLIAVFVSPSLWNGIGLWRAYVLEPLLVLLSLCALLDQPGDRKRMEQGMMVATSVVSIWAIIGYLGNWGIPHPWNVAISAGRRAVGPFGFPNAVALFVTPIGALMAARLATFCQQGLKQVKLRWSEWLPFLVTLLAVIIALVLAKSDGGLGALAFVLMLSFLTFRLGRWLVVLGAVGTAVGLIALPEIRGALISEITFQGWSGKVRLFIWRESWAMLKDHWFFGAGFGGYPTVFDAYHKARFIEIFQYPHTILFNFWTETGLLGIAAFVSLMVTWVKQSLKKQTLVLLAPLIAILVHGLVDVPYFKNDLALVFFLFVWFVIIAKQGDERLA